MKRKAEAGNAAALADLGKIVHPQNQLFWDAFCFLSRTRATGLNGAEPIQPGAIRDYCDLMGVTNQAQRLRLVSAISRMDAAFMEWGRE